jgi:soluble lytic murein transglycosylase-like protein
MQRNDRYNSLIEFLAISGGFPLPWQWLKAQIRQESNFDPEALSPRGAVGLAQFMPAAWADYGDGALEDRRNPEKNIRAQVKFMNKLLAKYNGSMEKALAAYNYGPRHVDEVKDDPKWFSRMPATVQSYVNRIKGFYDGYTA